MNAHLKRTGSATEAHYQFLPLEGKRVVFGSTICVLSAT